MADDFESLKDSSLHMHSRDISQGGAAGQTPDTRFSTLLTGITHID